MIGGWQLCASTVPALGIALMRLLISVRLRLNFAKFVLDETYLATERYTDH